MWPEGGAAAPRPALWGLIGGQDGAFLALCDVCEGAQVSECVRACVCVHVCVCHENKRKTKAESHTPPSLPLSGQLMCFCTQWSADPLLSDQIRGVCECVREREVEGEDGSDNGVSII